MKASELRIGNFVNFKDREDIDYCEVTALDAGGYIHLLRNFKDGDGDDQPEALEDITPIVLTEEWLIKFGFEATEVWGDYANEKLLICSDFKDDGRKISDSHEYYFSYGRKLRSRQIKHVHELQNLYHAITGSELALASTKPETT